ncbi:MAG: hypothetical protein ACE5GK_01275 [Nitrospiria bacterium]
MRSFLFLFILIYLAATSSTTNAQAVVVNKSVGQKEISKNALRAIFGMRLNKWPNGTGVKVFVLRDNAPLHIKFCKKVLNVFPHQLRRAWDRLIYSGTGQAPFEVASEKEMRQKIANTPGAIGYLVMEKNDTDVKILQVR